MYSHHWEVKIRPYNQHEERGCFLRVFMISRDNTVAGWSPVWCGGGWAEASRAIPGRRQQGGWGVEPGPGGCRCGSAPSRRPLPSLLLRTRQWHQVAKLVPTQCNLLATCFQAPTPCSKVPILRREGVMSRPASWGCLRRGPAQAVVTTALPWPSGLPRRKSLAAGMTYLGY